MVTSMAVMLGAARDRRFSIPDRSGHLFRHARRHPRRRPRRLAPAGAGRHPDQLGERLLKLPTDEQATAKQAKVTLRSPRHSSAIARSMRRVIR
jgi:hypothetical protein